MAQAFHYLPPKIAILHATLTEVMASQAPARLLLIAETERDQMLAQPAFAAVATQIAQGRKAPYQLSDQSGLQLVIFVDPAAPLDHRLYTQARSWVAPLAGLKLEEVALHLAGFDDGSRARLAELVLATLLAANVPLPTRKQQAEAPSCYRQLKVSPLCELDLARILAEAEGNGLARHLAVLPASELDAQGYRAFVQQLAQQEGWQWQEFDEAALATLGAGAFLAVARGSENGQAAIVR